VIRAVDETITNRSIIMSGSWQGIESAVHHAERLQDVVLHELGERNP
jgi:hypothetical protein